MKSPPKPIRERPRERRRAVAAKRVTTKRVTKPRTAKPASAKPIAVPAWAVSKPPRQRVCMVCQRERPVTDFERGRRTCEDCRAAKRKPPSLALQLMSAGVGKSHAYMISNGHRSPSYALALEVCRKAGVAIGPLAGLSEGKIASIRRLPAVDQSKPPLVLALWVFTRTGVVTGPLAELNKREIAVIADLHGEAAA